MMNCWHPAPSSRPSASAIQAKLQALMYSPARQDVYSTPQDPLQTCYLCVTA